ncbi:MAG: hypothetical protein CUN53_14810 [Phototrophicales bacterium]|nr:MAG: hypothetical protein CUN53_14810 [Phototrophicales bacterium]
MAALAIIGALSACDAAVDSTPPPTATLIAPPPTSTPTAAPPTNTSQSLPAPVDLIEAIPAEPTAEPSEDLVSVDPIAAELVALARSYVSQRDDLPLVRVRLVEITPYIWTDTSLGCPSPDVVYAPVLVDGYRIVLTTGDQYHLFHTDFDRIIPCSPENEVLPQTAE